MKVPIPPQVKQWQEEEAQETARQREQYESDLLYAQMMQKFYRPDYAAMSGAFHPFTVSGLQSAVATPSQNVLLGMGGFAVQRQRR